MSKEFILVKKLTILIRFFTKKPKASILPSAFILLYKGKDYLRA